jgi:signal transduction histidine kinase
MSRFVGNIIKLSTLTREKVIQVDVDLSTLARDAMRKVESEHTGIRVTSVVADGIHARGDARLLQIALEHLFDNAVKFADRRDGAHVEFGVLKEGDEEVFFVRDRGKGFDMELAEKKDFFDAFRRLKWPGEYEGAGLGLAIVHIIVRLHGGRIWAESKPGHGATFFFTFSEES